MRALIFIQTNDDKIYYKCDTFWSKSDKVKYAKIYRDSNQSEIDGWITPYDYNIHEYLKRSPEKLDEVMNLYHGCKMGYRTVNDKLMDGDFRLKEDVLESDLGELVYTHQVHINGLERPTIFDIRKKIIREEKLNEIFGEVIK